LREFSQTPLFGQGYATRSVVFGQQNAQILDDQWLGNLLETGLIGTFAWAWLFRRSIRRLSRRAKDDADLPGWLAASVNASIIAFVVGMFTFDAFAFAQVTMVVFILLAVGATLLAGEHGRASVAQEAGARA
jgi:O-antigen ligase